MSVQVEMLVLRDQQLLRGLRTTVTLVRVLPEVKTLSKQWPPKLTLSEKALRACFRAGFVVLNLSMDPLYRTGTQLVL